MHELTLIQSVVEICRERSRGAKVIRVTLEVGALTCVLPESLQFCYDVATRETPLQDSVLEIKRIRAQSQCRDCGLKVEVNNFFPTCVCGSVNLESPIGGHELRIRSMEIEEMNPETC